MKRKLSGEITIEIAIVLPVIMMIIASLVYFSFYVHDVISIKSYMYSVGVENPEENFKIFNDAVKEKIKKTPMFVLNANVLCSEEDTSFKINIKYDTKNRIKWMNRLIGNNKELYTIKIEKNMSRELIYICRAICDEIGE